MAKESVLDIMTKCLKKNKPHAYTGKDLCEYIFSNEREWCQEKRKEIDREDIKNDQAFMKHILAQICAKNDLQLEKVNIIRTSDRPHKYYYNEFDKINSFDNDINYKKNNQPEHELYSKLAKYCDSIGIKTLRINEHSSKNNKGRNFNKWLHADIVGFEDLIKDYEKELKDCLKNHGNVEASSLYAFEVKDGIILPSNLREYFFQTVSNSSWANYSYLVAEGLGNQVEKELQLLCSSFKIGFIKLDKESPEDSQILIQAQKTPLDWDMMDRIAKENSDFTQFLNNINLSYEGHTNKHIAKPEWDKF